MKNYATILGMTLSLVWIHSSKLYAQTESVTIHANQQMDTNTSFMQGFINGGASYNVPLTQHLKPSHWGFGWDVAADYDYAVPNFNLTKMASIYSAYMSYHGIGDPLLLQPWTDGYLQWDAFVTGMVNQSIATSRPIDFWSVWGEPDASFSGTPLQYAELFRRTDSLVHAVDPLAKMVGPDFINYEIDDLLFFIDSLHDLNIHPAAISWHEFGNNPQDIYFHAEEFRDSLVSRPFINPEIHIQEYGDPDNRQIPGWALGWLYYFESAKVNWASRACFNEFNGVIWWDDCWDGLSGMYMNDGVTTQPLYWVHRAYAELNADYRLNVIPSQPRTVAMASRNDVNNEMRIMVGRHYSQYQGFPDPAANVTIKVRNYPYGNNSTQPITIQRIPAQTVNYSTPLANPITTFTGNLIFTGDSATINLPAFVDGDVYVIYINPAAGSILSTEAIPDNNPIMIHPNPAIGEFMIEGLDTYEEMEITNDMGQVIYRSSIHQSSLSLSLPELAPGMYFVKVWNKENQQVNKLMIR